MAEETLVDALLAQLEARRLMTGWCIAYREDGQVCREPATLMDRQRHGLVCAAHAPAAAEPPYTTEEQDLLMDAPDLDTLEAQINALEAKFAKQAAAVHTTRPVAPPAAPTQPTPSAPPPTLRPERAALWRIAMLCKDALASPALPPAWRPYFVLIARVCREGIQRADSDRGSHGT